VLGLGSVGKTDLLADSTILRLCVAKKKSTKMARANKEICNQIEFSAGVLLVNCLCVSFSILIHQKFSLIFFQSNGRNPHQIYRFCPMNNFEKRTLETILEWLLQNSSPALMETAGRGSGFRGIAGRGL